MYSAVFIYVDIATVVILNEPVDLIAVSIEPYQIIDRVTLVD